MIEQYLKLLSSTCLEKLVTKTNVQIFDRVSILLETNFRPCHLSGCKLSGKQVFTKFIKVHVLSFPFTKFEVERLMDNQN